jgi:hypothetical protein
MRKEIQGRNRASGPQSYFTSNLNSFFAHKHTEFTKIMLLLLVCIHWCREIRIQAIP